MASAAASLQAELARAVKAEHHKNALHLSNKCMWSDSNLRESSVSQQGMLLHLARPTCPSARSDRAGKRVGLRDEMQGRGTPQRVEGASPHFSTFVITTYPTQLHAFPHCRSLPPSRALAVGRRSGVVRVIARACLLSVRRALPVGQAGRGAGSA